MPPSGSTIDYAPLPAVTDPRRRARRRCAADRRRSARQSVLRMADRRRRRGRFRVRGGGACRKPRARQPPGRHQPDGAARHRRALRPGSGRYTRYVSAQSIHATRDAAARALGVEPARLRFVAPDVGGGFGAKNFVYPEHVLMPWAAKRVGRPVKWIAGRCEVFLADHQGRGHQAEAALALDARGTLPGTAHRQQRQSRRLSVRQRRRRADFPVRVSARHRVPHPGNRAAGRRGVHQHRALRRAARPRLCRDGQHHRAADRPAPPSKPASTAPNCAAAISCRPRRCRPPTPSATASTAAPFPKRSRAPSPPPISPASPRGAATARRAGSCAGSASPITSRRPAARRRRMSISASSRTARSR